MSDWTLKILTWNVNGLRSVVRRDFGDWLSTSDFDVVCLQEVKVEEDLLTKHWFPGYVAHWNTAVRQGYSGVATLVRENLPVTAVTTGIGHPETDAEGRVLTLDVAGYRVMNVYAPHSHRQLTRLEAKIQFLNALSVFVATQERADHPIVLMGDLNIAHHEIDLANPKANLMNAGFRPEERAWMDRFLAGGYIDAFRHKEPGRGHYTWWSMRTGVRERNVGWRLDYALIQSSAIPDLIDCAIMSERQGSDHCPVYLNLRPRKI